MGMALMKIVSATALMFGLSVGGAIAQDYPNRPITLILPLGAGGSHDLNARVFTSIIPQYLDQAMIVKLMPGASGQTGTAAAAAAPADGYTLLFSHNYFDQMQQHVKNLPYDTTQDFVTVARLNSVRFCLIVRADSPHRTIEDLLDFGRANPGKLEFAHSGQWGAGMVPGARLLKLAQVDATMTPYRGGGPSMRALLAGNADFTLQLPSAVQEQGDKVRPLACVDDEPSVGSPPTLASLGFPSEIGEMHRIVMAPRGIPAYRLAVLRAAFARMQEDKTYQRMMGRLGEDTNLMDGAEYEPIRPKQSDAYKGLVDSMIKD